MKNREWYVESLLHAQKQLGVIIRDIERGIAVKSMPLDRRKAIRRLNYAINIIALADEDNPIDPEGDWDG
ncbi:hypothetical protein ACVNSK_10610 [Corynebacterium propinquum]